MVHVQVGTGDLDFIVAGIHTLGVSGIVAVIGMVVRGIVGFVVEGGLPEND